MIVGIAGRIGSGKDTAAQVLVREHGFRVFRFSAALKREVFGLLRRTLEAYASDRYPIVWDSLDPDGRLSFVWKLLTEQRDNVTRALLQEYGTQIRRGDDKDYWVGRWREEVEASGALRVVVPDVRFPNEAGAIRGMGGKLIRLIRPNAPPVASHESETSLDGWTDWDETVGNDRGTEVLQERIRQIAVRWGLEHVA